MREQFLEAYLDWIDTAFFLNGAGVMQERRELLRSSANLITKVYFEVIPSYEGGLSLRDACSNSGLTEMQIKLLETALFPGGTVYPHQATAFNAAINELKNPVVVTGTGSGKTEAFLLPLLASILIDKGKQLTATPDIWWNKTAARPLGGVRSSEMQLQSPSMKAILMYPTNALVEDQMSRLRRAIRALVDPVTGAPLIWFGRFTGAGDKDGNKLPGDSGDRKDIEALRRHLTGLDFSYRQAREQSVKTGDAGMQELLNFMSSPRDGELLSRIDMREAAPDILVTNHSMLNVMLMREKDDNIFDSTRNWLAQSQERRFTLVVDELHLQRGSAGAEVGLVIRNLFRRLGLEPGSERIRILATSASLGGEAQTSKFAMDFFGIPKEKFSVISGDPTQPSRPVAFSTSDLAALTLAGMPPEEAIPRVHEVTGLLPSELLAFAAAEHGTQGTGVKGQPGIIREDELGEALFPGEASGAETASRLIDLSTFEHTLEGLPRASARIRAHMFVRVLKGLWACVDPSCPEVDPAYRYSGRPIGKLFASPRIGCIQSCSARVLEVLYCDRCGDISLGGFALDNIPGSLELDRTLTAASANQSSEIDLSTRSRAMKTYSWYRPGLDGNEANEPVQVHGYRLGMVQVQLDPFGGRLSTPLDGTSTGLSWLPDDKVSIDAVFGDESKKYRIPALPTFCPACLAQKDKKGKSIASDKKRFEQGNASTPIRGHTPGQAAAVGLIAERLFALAEDSAARRSIVFSDSRAEAARIAASLDSNHFRLLIKGLTRRITQKATLISVDQIIEMFSREAMGEASQSDLINLKPILETGPGQEIGQLVKRKMFRALSFDEQQTFSELMVWLQDFIGSGMPWGKLIDLLTEQLVNLGECPAGPAFDRQSVEVGADEEDWFNAYSDVAAPNRVKNPVDDFVLSAERKYRERAREHLAAQVADVAFDRLGRDFEASLGGYIFVRVQQNPIVDWAVPMAGQIVASALRILGVDGRAKTSSSRTYYAATEILSKGVVDYVERVVRNHGDSNQYTTESANLKTWLEQELGRLCADDNYLHPTRVDSWPVTFMPASNQIFVCRKCSMVHAHDSAQTCIRRGCSGLIEPKHALARTDYWFKAGELPARRLHAKELTGTTRLSDQQDRARRFQGFLFDRESAIASPVDLLSATTTLEMGVDVGGLRTVINAAMPPTRYNYQQRVGRSGRRSDAVFSSAITIARNRFHDDHYYADPLPILRGVPPAPILDVSRSRIISRVVNAEILRTMFSSLSAKPDWHPDDTHGSFGTASEWPAFCDSLKAFLAVRSGIDAIVASLTVHTGLSKSDEQRIYESFDNLPDRISSLAREECNVSPDTRLSLLLARAGLLPLFGFPTNLRSLWVAPHGGEPAEWESRDLEISLSDFAPGQERIKDKQIATAIGFVNYTHAVPRKLLPALGTEYVLSKCEDCGNTNVSTNRLDSQLQHCIDCSGKLNTTKFVEPQGYLAYHPFAYDDGDDDYVSVSSATLASPISLEATKKLIGMNYAALQQASLVRVNDNLGKLYSFHPSGSNHQALLYTEPGAYRKSNIAKEVERDASKALYALSTGEDSFAIGQNKTGDVALFWFDQASEERSWLPDGVVRIGSDCPSGESALWSFGELLKRGAQEQFDISSNELDLGLSYGRIAGQRSGRIFIADVLANGAGFSTEIGQESTLRELLNFLDGEVREKLTSNGHASECDSSCPKCLRGYETRTVHGLLNWRMALDLTSIALGRDPNMSEWTRVAERLGHGIKMQNAQTQSIAIDSIQDVIVLVGPKNIIALGHPLWSKNQFNFTRLQAEVASAILISYGREPIWTDPGEVARFPYSITAKLFS
jgi:DEAD/DEAH box helicase domain-containing protein